MQDYPTSQRGHPNLTGKNLCMETESSKLECDMSCQGYSV